MSVKTGKISLSHNHLYFPPSPSSDSYIENAITIGFTPAEEDASSSAKTVGAVLFKIKCSAPQKFHVNPKLGGFVVAPQTQFSTADLVVTLKGEGGAMSSLGARSPCVSVAQKSERPLAPGDLRHDYQERFSVEGYFIAGQAIADAVTQILNSKRKNDFQQLFDDNCSSASNENVTVFKAIAIKVHLENVTLSGEGATGGCVVVPSEAKVTVKSFAATRSSVNDDERSKQLLTSPSKRKVQIGTDAQPSEAYNAEVMRLREELERLEAAIAETERDKSSLETSVSNLSAQEQRKIAKQNESKSNGRGGGEETKRRQGIPMLLVIALMGLTFGIAVYFRDSALRNPFSLTRHSMPEYSPDWEDPRGL